MRNEFNHCMYVLDERGEITHTNHMRVQEVKGRLQLGIVRPMDDARIRELQNAIRSMTQLSRDIWDFMGVLQKYLAGRPRPHAPPFQCRSPDASLARAARERQPHATADQNDARQSAEPSCGCLLEKQGAAGACGDGPACIGDGRHRD